MRPLELLFVVALVLYSFVIWWHRLKTHKLHAWMAVVFGLGLTADVAGTVFLCVVSATRWSWTLHTISGLLALLIMASHFAWAVRATTAGGRAESNFTRFSVWAWWIWVVAFVSGIPRS
jgi:uncharacterized repeat protein (TIGR03987 family)